MYWFNCVPLFLYIMSKLVDELAKSFDECLDSVLSDPQQQKEEGNDGKIKHAFCLKRIVILMKYINI